MNESESSIKLIDIALIDPIHAHFNDDEIVLDEYEPSTYQDVSSKLQALMLNDSTPDEMFANLVERFPHIGASSSRVTMLELWKMWDDFDNSKILGNKNVHADLCEASFASGKKNEILAILNNPVHLRLFSRRALMSEDTDIVSAALKDPSLTLEDLEPYLGGADETFWPVAVRHPSVTAARLVEILEDSPTWLRACALGNSNFPPSFFHKYINDWFEVRLAISGNPNCPEHVILDLIAKSWGEIEVIQSALMNPALGDEALEQIFQELSHSLKCFVLENRKLSPTFLANFLKSDSGLNFNNLELEQNSQLDHWKLLDILEAISSNEGLSEPLIESIFNKLSEVSLSDRNSKILENLVSHKNVSPVRLLDLCKEIREEQDDYVFYSLDPLFTRALTNSNLNLNQVVGDRFDSAKNVEGFEVRVEMYKAQLLFEKKDALNKLTRLADRQDFQAMCVELQNSVDVDFWDSFSLQDLAQAQPITRSPLPAYWLVTLPKIRLSEAFVQKFVDNFDAYLHFFASPQFGGTGTLLSQPDSRIVANNPYLPESVKALFRQSL